MTAPFKRSRRRRRFCSQASAVIAAVFMMASSAGAETLTVFLDQAKVTKLPERTATIIVGNPLIADVTIQAGGLMVITGKGYGVTNLVALDRSGTVLREQSIEVQGPLEDVVVVYRGVNRESYSCTPICERRITLGDTPEFFETTLGETSSRNGSAAGNAVTPGR